MRRKNWRIVIVCAGVFLLHDDRCIEVKRPCSVDADGWNSFWCRRRDQPRHDHHRADRQKGLAWVIQG